MLGQAVGAWLPGALPAGAPRLLARGMPPADPTLAVLLSASAGLYLFDFLTDANESLTSVDNTAAHKA